MANRNATQRSKCGKKYQCTENPWKMAMIPINITAVAVLSPPTGTRNTTELVTEPPGPAAPTSMISVCACLVQKAWGGVVTLTATKLFGFRSSEGVCSSLQAVESRWERKKSFKTRLLVVLCSKYIQRAKKVNDTQRDELLALSVATRRWFLKLETICPHPSPHPPPQQCPDWQGQAELKGTFYVHGMEHRANNLMWCLTITSDFSN